MQPSANHSQLLVKGIQHLISKNQVDLIPGRGRLDENGAIAVTTPDGQTVNIARPPALVLATGSRPTDIRIAPRD